MSILSIQSHVCYGHVGNAAAVFPLQRLGYEVWPVMTVQFSNHPGYDTWEGEVFSPRLIEKLVDGMGAAGALRDCEAVLSGYLGHPAVGDSVLEAVAQVRAANPDAVYLCDPVMGDRHSGVFVREGVPEYFRELVLDAVDILTPNLFELEILSGGAAIKGADAAVDAARRLIDRGPKVVVTTSADFGDTAPEEITLVAVTADGAWRLSTPRLAFDHPVHGAGDLWAALFLGHFLASGGGVPAALERSTNTVLAILEATKAAGVQEMRLVACQEVLADPPSRYAAEALG